MLCIHCGAENSVTAIFCQKCGKRLETTEQNEPTLLSPSAEPAAPYENLFYTVPDSSGPIYPPPPPGISYGSTSTSDQPPPSPPRRHLRVGLTSLIVGMVLLLLAGSGVTYYTTVYQPNQHHTQATATAQIQEIATIHAQQVLATTQAQQGTATAFANTPQSIYILATSGSPVLNDSLNGQNANNWDEGSTTDGGCVFTGQAYHISIQLQSSYESCFAEATNFSDFAFQVEMTILKGDGGGLLFRAGNGNDPNGYRFFVGRDFYNLDYGPKELIRTSTSFKANLNQSYLLTAIVRGSSISVYVDTHWLGSAEDSSARSGKIGFAGTDFTNKAEVVFRNAQVWIL